MNQLLSSPENMATKSPKGSGGGIPVKFDPDTYRDLKDIARVQGRTVQEVARELLRASLALQMARLGAEVSRLRKEDEARAARLAKSHSKNAS